MNKDERALQLINELNRVDLPGFEDILVGDVLHYPINSMQEQLKGGILKRIIKGFYWYYKILYRLSNEFIISYHPEESSSALFLFSSSYAGRDDLKKEYKTLTSLFPGSTRIEAQKCKVRWRLGKLIHLKTVLGWGRIIKKDNICDSIFERIYILRALSEVFSDYIDAKNSLGDDLLNYNVLVSWCDIHPVDSFFVQMFNKANKLTIDLMHGSISMGHNAWSVKGVKSQCFIADSLYTRDILSNNGYNGKIFVCGYPNAIGNDSTDNIKDTSKFVNTGRKNIGVIFSAASLHEDNISLCKCLQGLKKNGYSFFAKLHPTEKKEDYDIDVIELFDEIYEREITSIEFLKERGAAIIMPSTVIFQAISLGIPFIICKDSRGFCDEYGMPETIISEMGEIETKVIDMLDGKYNEQYTSMRTYYTAPGNVRDNYITIFNSLGIN